MTRAFVTALLSAAVTLGALSAMAADKPKPADIKKHDMKRRRAANTSRNSTYCATRR